MTLTAIRLALLLSFSVTLTGLGLASDIQLRIATRDDVPDSAYIERAMPYQAVGQIIIGNRRCTGTLVRTTDGSHKVLTAAHCFDRDFDNLPDIPAASVQFQLGATLEGATVKVRDISIPAWNKRGGMDLAVLSLEAIAEKDCPIPMTVSTISPLSKEVLLIGYGTHGTGLPPFENLPDNKRRAATNIADQLFDSGENAGQIQIDFDAPLNPDFSTLGDSQPTPLEGTSGIGDSGAPLILDQYIVGVLHGGFNPTQFQFSEYGDVSIFAGTYLNANSSFLAKNNILLIDEGTAEVTITVDSIAQPGQPFVANSSGLAVKDGTTIHVGSFLEGFEPAGSDFYSIAKQWLPFGKTKTLTFAEQSGRFSASCIGDSTILATKRIYWWILETDRGEPAADLSNIINWGLFSSNLENWLFPLPGTPPSNATLLSSSDVDWAVHANSIGIDQLTLQSVQQLEYATWADREFPAGLPSNLRAPDTDLDDDGLSNAMEWVMGTSPLLPNSSPPIRITHSSGNTTIRYSRSKSLPPGSHRFEFSTSLSDWQPVESKVIIVEPASEIQESAVVEIAESNETSGSSFFRLVATP